MITTITLGSVSLKCNKIDKPPVRKFVNIQIPGRDADIVQDLGAGSTTITLEGALYGSSFETNRTTLLGYIGTNVTYNDGELNTTCYVQSVNIPLAGGTTSYYRFTIMVVI